MNTLTKVTRHLKRVIIRNHVARVVHIRENINPLPLYVRLALTFTPGVEEVER